MQDNIPDALISAFERQYDADWNNPQLRNERLAMRYGWAAAMEAKQCLHQIQEPAAVPVVLPEPATWTLQSELDARQTTTSGHLWFSNPVNALWTALYTEQQVRALLATGGQGQTGEVLGWVYKTKSGEIGNHFHTYEPHCDFSVRNGGGEKIAVIAASGAAPQPQADARDAGRYRDLRSLLHGQDVVIDEATLIFKVTGQCPTVEEFDAGVDRAVAAAKGE